MKAELLRVKNGVAILKKTPVFNKAAVAENLVADLIDIVIKQEERIRILENGK